MDEKSEEENLAELKDMLIGRWMLENRSDTDWKEYKEKADESWIRMEGMKIWLSEEVIDLMVDKSEEEVWRIFRNFIRSTVSSGEEQSQQCSLVRLCTSASDRVGQGRDRWSAVMCRWLVGGVMLGWILMWLLKRRAVGIHKTNPLMYYFVKLLELDDIEMVLLTILMGERMFVNMDWSSEEKDQLRTALTRHSTHTNTDILTGALDLDLVDFEKYQVGWCARWYEDNLLGEDVRNIPKIKLSRDRLEARCDDLSSFPVRSPFPVTSNVYFYEVIFMEKDEIELGWTTRESRIRGAIDCGGHQFVLHIGNNDKYYKYYKYDKYFHHKSFPFSHFLRPVNVVGCLLDVDNRRFEFYLNGWALNCQPPPHISSQPYFATTLLYPNQQCHFNFGQSPFKYPPRNIRFTTFDEQSGGDARKYRLMEGEYYEDDFDFIWFKHIPVDNKVSLFFCDEIQKEFDKEVARVEEDIKNDRDIGKLRLEGQREIGEEWRCLRYLQAIIEMKVGGGDKVDVMAQWVGLVIGNNIYCGYKEKLFELLYPYLHLVPTWSTIVQHRSICIVLMFLIKTFPNYEYDMSEYRTIEPIRSFVFTYLTRTLISTHDEWTQLFVLLALENLEMSEDEKKEIEDCGKIGQIMDRWKTQFEKENVVKLFISKHEFMNTCRQNRLLYQLHICSSRLLPSANPSISFSTSTLNLLDLTSHLTLSPCHLSARSDTHWQSVRSVCKVSAHIYYFEVVLLTSGPMIIGWATKITELNKITNFKTKDDKTLMIGFDEFSIGFDGFNRCIYHDYKTFQLENIPRWKSGDIVGCVIDKNKKTFHFYLNGSEINFSQTKSPIYFSRLPHHALICLSQFQQVYLNFGQFNFSRYRPKYVDFCDFYSNRPEIQEKQGNTIVNFQSAVLERNLITIDSNVQQGNVSISERAAKSANLSDTIGNISSVSTIASVNVEDDNSHSFKSMKCRLCCKSSSTKLVRFVCCDTLPLCLDCLRTMAECPKCKKQTNDSQTDESQPKEPKPIHRCTLCTTQRASYRFISCDHFNLCQTCVNQVSFKDCPRCPKQSN